MNFKYLLSLTLVFSLLFLQSCTEDQSVYEVETEQTELNTEVLSSRTSRFFKADFITSVNVINNQAFVTFINTSRFASTFEWSFPEGTPESSTSRNPQSIYTQNGTFLATLTVRDRNGSKDTITKEFIVSGIEGGGDGNENPEQIQVNARFFTSIRIVNNQAQVTISNLSENAESFEWSFPGGTPATSTLENPVITYPRNGIFTISLVAFNGEVSDSTTQNISINSIPDENIEEPVVDVRARFFFSIRRVNGQFQVTLRNRSTNATNFQWSFPGGTPATSTEENPTITYAEGGTKTITLIASNGDVSSTRTVNLSL